MSKSEFFPLHKEQIIKEFGYISYQLVLANVDVIGIRVLNSYEVVVITFCKNQKTGFIYEGSTRTNEQNFKLFADVPEDRNDLEKYKRDFANKTEVLYPPKHNYVFVNDREVKEIKK